ncbi:MAG: isocitrate/isopropylmalate family dehydrogenase, partial [Acidimicrobiia bacterium]|nr:isocitrate/isopropylmalate family dehydrogenase [Acidimicrobiia bacterium]
MTYRLAVIGGDGVGPEVVAESLKVLEVAASRFGFGYTTSNYELGGSRYLSSGEVLPDSVEGELAGHDAILLGAVGTPEVPPGVLERGLLLKLRFDFDQYVNLRPVKLYPGVPTPIAGLTPDRCDMVVVRENTEGLYVGAGGITRRNTA